MSFGAGFGAGMGAGIGAGIAIGTSSGRKKAVEQLREHININGLTLHDRQGKEVPVESLLAEAAGDAECESKNTGWALAIAFSLLLGFAVMALLFLYFQWA